MFHPEEWARLAERIKAKAKVDPQTGCHDWEGSLNHGGYGLIDLRIEGAPRRARVHRLTYELAKGAIPAGLVIDHLCRNRRCCNPNHLEAVTHLENLRRGIPGRGFPGRGGRPRETSSHCKRGHERSPENRYWRGEYSECLLCKKLLRSGVAA